MKIGKLKYPSSDKIKSRTSTIARSMASTIVPRIPCTPEDNMKIASILQMDLDKPTCVYCGQPANHLDHLHPLIVDIFPSGYCSDPGNLVPCCRRCNQDKGSDDWESFMETHRERFNSDGGHKDRVGRLQRLTEEMPPLRIRFDQIPGFRETWDREYNSIKDALDHAQNALDSFKDDVKKEMAEREEKDGLEPDSL